MSFDDDDRKVSYTPHGDGYLVYRQKHFDGTKPVYCGFGKTKREADLDYNAGLKSMKASEWYGTKHG